ncbi:MAG: hypothetical protein ACI8PD_001136 [Nitrospinales bacterium]|jgi:hypothetical protein
MTKFITTILILLSACSSAPEIIPGKGSLYGTISAESHKDIIAKASKDDGSVYGNNGQVVFKKGMVNYHQLKELYVCLINPSLKSEKDHLLIADNDKMSHRSLAIARGDRLWVQNNSSKTLTFFLAGHDDDIQVYSPVKPGERSVIEVEQEGILELGSDENEALITTLNSRVGLISQIHSSGEEYLFSSLDPGRYKILFWFWRLGFIEKNITIKAGENVKLNQILSVDKIMANKNDP